MLVHIEDNWRLRIVSSAGSAPVVKLETKIVLVHTGGYDTG